MDRKGTHIGACNHSNGYRQLRHDSVCTTVVSYLSLLKTMEGNGGIVSGETPYWRAGLENNDPTGKHRLDWRFQPRPGPPRAEELIMGNYTVALPLAALGTPLDRLQEMMGPTVFDEKGRILKGGGRTMAEAAAIGVARKLKHYTAQLGAAMASRGPPLPPSVTSC
jgi:hypothetical protein